MKIISFAWTTPALLAGRKTVTRREWNDRHALRFRKGDLVAAYNRQPRFGGHQVATIRLTRDAYKESTALAPPEDFEAEGFAYCEEHGLKVDGWPARAVWRSWRLNPDDWWVVRFEVVELVAAAPEPKPATPQLALPMEAT